MPLQLAILQRAGIPIPRTMITNFPAALKAFERDVGEIIFKPTAGGGLAKTMDDDARAKVADAIATPVIFQERIRGPDIRATVVGSRVVSCVEIPTEGLDYRSSESYAAGQQTYVNHTLPGEIEEMCLRVARLCGHVLSGIDLKKDGDRYVVIEANSGPVYLDIERKMGHPITEAIVDVLTRTAA